MMGDMSRVIKNRMISKSIIRVAINYLSIAVYCCVFTACSIENSYARNEEFVDFSYLNKEMKNKTKKYEKEVNELKEGFGKKVKKYERDSKELSKQAEKLKVKAIKENKDFFGDIEKLKKKSGRVSGRRYVF